MKLIFFKIVALFAISINFQQIRAQEPVKRVSEDDFNHIQDLIDKNILIHEGNEVRLSDLLNADGLIHTLDNTKGANCGNGSCW